MSQPYFLSYEHMKISKIKRSCFYFFQESKLLPTIKKHIANAIYSNLTMFTLSNTKIRNNVITFKLFRMHTMFLNC